MQPVSGLVKVLENPDLRGVLGKNLDVHSAANLMAACKTGQDEHVQKGVKEAILALNLGFTLASQLSPDQIYERVLVTPEKLKSFETALSKPAQMLAFDQKGKVIVVNRDQYLNKGNFKERFWRKYDYYTGKHHKAICGAVARTCAEVQAILKEIPALIKECHKELKKEYANIPKVYNIYKIIENIHDSRKAFVNLLDKDEKQLKDTCKPFFWPIRKIMQLIQNSVLKGALDSLHGLPYLYNSDAKSKIFSGQYTKAVSHGGWSMSYILGYPLGKTTLNEKEIQVYAEIPYWEHRQLKIHFYDPQTGAILKSFNLHKKESASKKPQDASLLIDDIPRTASEDPELWRTITQLAGEILMREPALKMDVKTYTTYGGGGGGFLGNMVMREDATTLSLTKKPALHLDGSPLVLDSSLDTVESSHPDIMLAEGDKLKSWKGEIAIHGPILKGDGPILPSFE